MRKLGLPDYAIIGLLLAVAATAAFSGGMEQQTPALNFTWRVLNIALVAAIIWKLAGSGIATFFRGRQAGIARELEELETRKEKARQGLTDIETRIANLDRERAAILADYEARGEALRMEIITRAEENAKLIVDQARQAAETEREAALAALREELADKIIHSAREAIVASLKGKDQEKLIRSSLNADALERFFAVAAKDADKGVLQ